MPRGRQESTLRGSAQRRAACDRDTGAAVSVLSRALQACTKGALRDRAVTRRPRSTPPTRPPDPLYGKGRGAKGGSWRRASRGREPSTACSGRVLRVPFGSPSFLRGPGRRREPPSRPGAPRGASPGQMWSRRRVAPLLKTTLRQGWPLVLAQGRNVRSKCRCSCVLQFTRRRAVCCVFHRPTSRVIHRSG